MENDDILWMIVDVGVHVSAQSDEGFNRTWIVSIDWKCAHILYILFNIVFCFGRYVVYGVVIVVLAPQKPAELIKSIVLIKVTHHGDTISDITEVEFISIFEQLS